MKLRPSPFRQLGLLAISLAFVALGGLLVSRGEPFGWVCVAFFGLGVVVAVLYVLPVSSYLQLTDTGMELSSLYRKWFIPWADVQEFFPVRVATRSMVCWRHAPGHAAPTTGRKLSMRFAGVAAGLPDTYGLTAQELSDLLNKWRMGARE